MENNLKKLLIKHGFSFKKAYGQNFLTDESLLSGIVEKSGVTKDDVVLEIGCGAGALTRALAQRAKKVVGYEIDDRLKPVLNETVGEFDNVEIIFKDALSEKLSEIEKKLGDEYVMVANLPYYITTPVVMKFVENSKKIKSLVIMVQEEVAKRFSANPKSSDYGAVTVGINLRGSAKIVEYVGREKFIPSPNVDSAVVKIDIDRTKFLNVDLLAVREAVKCGFLSRRKMLVNNVMNYYKMPREKALNVLCAANIPSTERGESLSVEDYIRLAESVRENGE